MIQGPDYLFAIQDKDFRFWQIDSAGKVVCSAQPYMLQYSPAGWRDIEIDNVRNKKYFGVDRSVSSSLQFVNDGAKILRHIWTTKGVNQETFLAICNQRLEFEPLPKGKITFHVGQSPFTPNVSTTGIITGNPGDVVKIRMFLTSVEPPDDYVDGTIGTTTFLYQGFILSPYELQPEIFFTFTIPQSGEIAFNITFHQGAGSGSVAGMEIVNENGNQASYFFWYKQIFRGQFDWLTYNHAGSKVSVNSLEDGLARYLKAREGIVMEFPLDVPQREYVKMDGIILHNIVENFVNDGTDQTDPNYQFGNHLIDILITKEDAPQVSGKKSVVRTKVSNSNSAIKATGGWFAEANQDGIMELEYDFPVTVTFNPPPGINPAATYFIVVRRIDTTGFSNLQHVLLTLPGNQINGNERRIQGSASMVFRPGDQFYLYAFCNVQGATGDAQIITSYSANGNSFFKYKYKYREPTSYVPVRTGADLFTEFISKLTDGNYSADITGLLTDDYNKKFTSGNGLRILDGALIKYSFNDFFKFWDVWRDAGLSVSSTNVVKLQRKIDLVNYNNIKDLGQVSNLTITMATDIMVNRIKIGWPDKKQEGINGKEAFCNTFEWSVETLITDRELDKTCNTVVDCYSAELTRVLFDDRDTTDSQQDNDNYCIHTEDVLQPAAPPVPAHYNLNRSLNPGTTGLLEPETVFNLGMTPGRCFQNNEPYFHSIFDLMDDKKIKFQTSSRNNAVVCNGLVEKADRQISMFAAPYFRPIYLEFDISGVFDLLELLDSDPLQLFSFQIDGSTYTILPEKLSITPASGGTQRFKGLCAAGTDLSPLIEFYG